jgi:hypothetical protein
VGGPFPRGRTNAHDATNVAHHLRRDGTRLVRPHGQHALELGRIGPDRVVALAHRGEILDHGVGHRDLEVAIATGGELALDRLRRGVAGDGGNLDQVGDSRLVLAPHDLGAGVGDRAPELAPHHIGVVQDEHGALLGAARGGHLAVGLLKVAHPRPHHGHAQDRGHEHLAETAVETLGDVPHQLDVLALVLSHRHLLGPVGEHVGRLQHRVEEQAGGRQLALAEGLVAELVHAVELAHRGHRREQPAQLGVLLDVALAEEDAAVGVEAGRDQDRGRVVDALAQLGRVVGHRDGVQVHDAVDRRVAALLSRDVLRDGADVVAKVLCARGLNPREDAHVARAAGG